MQRRQAVPAPVVPARRVHPVGNARGEPGVSRPRGRELVRRYRLKEARTPACTCDAEPWVTPEIWDEVVALVTQAARLVHRRHDPCDLTAVGFRMTDRDVSTDAQSTGADT